MDTTATKKVSAYVFLRKLLEQALKAQVDAAAKRDTLEELYAKRKVEVLNAMIVFCEGHLSLNADQQDVLNKLITKASECLYDYEREGQFLDLVQIIIMLSYR